MDIRFRDNKLKKYTNNDSLAKRKLGTKRAKLYKARLDDLHDAESLEELRHVPGKYHELTQDRRGQWSCNLDQPYRLIFVPQDHPIPIDEDGKYIWIEIKRVEVINYHKER